MFSNGKVMLSAGNVRGFDGRRPFLARATEEREEGGGEMTPRSQRRTKRDKESEAEDEWDEGHCEMFFLFFNWKRK